MCGTDQRHVNVRLAADLLLRNDDLRGKGILRVGNRMIQQTNAADDLSLDAYLKETKKSSKTTLLWLILIHC